MNARKVDYLLANGVFILPEDLRGTEDFSISAFIEAMQMYKEKDRYIKLPCKVGDTVWHKEEGYLLDSYKIKFIYNDMTASNISRDLLFSVEDIGKTVFLTKEEAEEKLKELENNG